MPCPYRVGRTAIGLAGSHSLLPFHLHLLLHDPTVAVQTVGNTLEFVIAALLMRHWLGRGPSCR